jgi:hypothetical protein
MPQRNPRKRELNYAQEELIMSKLYLMVDYEQSVDCFEDLETARVEGQKLCDAEPLPSVWTIADEEGNTIETIERTDGKDLQQQMQTFRAKA